LFVAGIGAGKTHALCCATVVNALTMPSVDGAIFAPSYRLLRRVVLPKFFELCPKELYQWTEFRQELLFANGVRVYCLSTMRIDDVVGLNLGWILMDEAGA